MGILFTKLKQFFNDISLNSSCCIKENDEDEDIHDINNSKIIIHKEHITNIYNCKEEHQLNK